jgi:hypothetical protein
MTRPCFLEFCFKPGLPYGTEAIGETFRYPLAINQLNGGIVTITIM